MCNTLERGAGQFGYQAPPGDTGGALKPVSGMRSYGNCAAGSFAGRRNVYVNTLIAAENAATKNEKPDHHDDYKDHQDGYYSSTTATTIVSHAFILLSKWLPGGCFTPE